MEVYNMVNYNFTLDGFCVQVSQLDDTRKKEEFIFKRFLSYAQKKAKYYAHKHDMSVEYCTSFIATILYDRYCDIKERDIVKNGYYNAVECLSMIKTLSQLKHALLHGQYLKPGVYTSEKVIPETEISFKDSDGNKYGYKLSAAIIDSQIDMKSNTHNVKMWDIVDICTMWENRKSSHDSKIEDAIIELNSNGVKLDTSSMNEDDKKELNKKMRSMAKVKNDLRNLTELNGNYGTPELNYLQNEFMLYINSKVSEIVSSDRVFNRVYEVLNKDDKLEPFEEKIIKRFRDRHGLYYDVEKLDGTIKKHTAMSLEDLRYLFA